MSHKDKMIDRIAQHILPSWNLPAPPENENEESLHSRIAGWKTAQVGQFRRTLVYNIKLRQQFLHLETLVSLTVLVFSSSFIKRRTGELSTYHHQCSIYNYFTIKDSSISWRGVFLFNFSLITIQTGVKRFSWWSSVLSHSSQPFGS